MIPPVRTPSAPLLDAPTGDKTLLIPLARLPAGVKQGDTLEFWVDYVDEKQGVASISTGAAMEERMPEDRRDVREGAEPQADEGEGLEAPYDPNDTSVLLGPMKGLRNYLVQKSQDVSKNQGR